MRGKLIVIDGTDGSGKTTQIQLLLNYLKKSGVKTKRIDFPRYQSSFHGSVVGRYLKGEFGDLKQVNPYLASLTYALDRLTAKEQMRGWIKNGFLVIADRYTSSNMAYQSAKLPPRERAKFVRWVTKMEYGVHKLPKEDIVIFLHVPIEVGRKLVDHRGGRDIHERDLDYQKTAEKIYVELCAANPHWIKIECMGRDGKLRALADIHEQIVRLLKERNIIK